MLAHRATEMRKVLYTTAHALEETDVGYDLGKRTSNNLRFTIYEFKTVSPYVPLATSRFESGNSWHFCQTAVPSGLCPGGA